MQVRSWLAGHPARVVSHSCNVRDHDVQRAAVAQHASTNGLERSTRRPDDLSIRSTRSRTWSAVRIVVVSSGTPSRATKTFRSPRPPRPAVRRGTAATLAAGLDVQNRLLGRAWVRQHRPSRAGRPTTPDGQSRPRGGASASTWPWSPFAPGETMEHGWNNRSGTVWHQVSTRRQARAQDGPPRHVPARPEPVLPRSGRRDRRFKSCYPDHICKALTCGDAVSESPTASTSFHHDVSRGTPREQPGNPREHRLPPDRARPPTAGRPAVLKWHHPAPDGTATSSHPAKWTRPSRHVVSLRLGSLDTGWGES